MTGEPDNGKKKGDIGLRKCSSAFLCSVHAHKSICICVHVCMHACVCVCECQQVSTFPRILHGYVCVFVHACMCVCLRMWMIVFVCLCAFVFELFIFVL